MRRVRLHLKEEEKLNCVNSFYTSARSVVAFAGENAIVIVAGANMLLGKGELQRAQAALEKAKVVVCQLEVSPDTSLKALQMAQQNHGQFSTVCLFVSLSPSLSEALFWDWSSMKLSNRNISDRSIALLINMLSMFTKH